MSALISPTPSPSNGSRHSPLGLALGAVTLIGTFAGLTALVSFVGLFRVIEGVLLGIMFIVALAEYMGWWRKGEVGSGKNRPLEFCVTAQLVVLPFVALAVIAFAPSKFTLLLFSGVFLLLGGVRVWLNLRCCSAKRAHAKMASPRPVIPDEMNLSVGDINESTVQAKPAVWPLVWEALGYTREIGAVISAIVILTIAVAVTTDTEAAVRGKWIVGPTTKEVEAAEAQKAQKAKEVKEAKAKALEEARVRAKHALEVEAESANGNESSSEVSSTAPEHCEKIINTGGAGPSVVLAMEEHFQDSPVALGCPRGIRQANSAIGPIYWCVGYLEKAEHPSGIVVMSPGDIYFVAVWPAVEPIEGLLKEKLPLAAPRRFPRYYVGNGSFYLLWSPSGSYILEQETLKNGLEAVPFKELPPSLATAALSTDKQDKRWLWIRGHRSVKVDEEAFEFVGPGGATETIYFNTVSHVAERGPEPWRYPARQENLNIEELLNWRGAISPREERFETELEKAEG